jgi:hypothetical protein
MLALTHAVLAVCLFTALPAVADDKDTHTGKVVSVTGNKLLMVDKDGKNEHMHMVSDTAKITCDGKDCKLADLKAGMPIRVTTKKEGDKTMATKIEAQTQGFEK